MGHFSISTLFRAMKFSLDVLNFHAWPWESYDVSSTLYNTVHFEMHLYRKEGLNNHYLLFLHSSKATMQQSEGRVHLQERLGAFDTTPAHMLPLTLEAKLHIC